MTEKFGLRIDRLQAARKNHGWSQRELSRRCGFSDALVRIYESGVSDPSGYSLKMLAEQLQISTDYLLGVTDDPHGHVGDGTLSSEDELILNTFRREGWPGLLRLGAEKISK